MEKRDVLLDSTNLSKEQLVEARWVVARTLGRSWERLRSGENCGGVYVSLSPEPTPTGLLY
jgi:hypothetical protein